MNTKLKIFVLFIAVFLSSINTKVFSQENIPLTYDLPLEYLVQIEIIDDTNSSVSLEPTYELSIEDLMNLEIVKKLVVNDYIDVNYEIPLEDLMQIRIPANKKALGVEPTYEMSMEGLLELELKKDYSIIDKIDISYDISIDGLMKLSILKK